MEWVDLIKVSEQHIRFTLQTGRSTFIRFQAIIVALKIISNFKFIFSDFYELWTLKLAKHEYYGIDFV